MSELRNVQGRPIQERVFRWILVAGFLFSLAANLPGHLSLDSVNALHEARNDIQISWAPVTFAWIIKFFDEALAGTGLYLTACMLVLYASLWSLPRLRPRLTWFAPAVALGAVVTPQFFVFQGIVWRDVLFANLAVAAFVLIAHATSRWGSRRAWVAIGLAMLCLALGAAIRQNGFVVIAAAGAVLAWTARREGLVRMLVWAVGGALATALLAVALNLVATPTNRAPGLRPDAGMRILQQYDVVGVVARGEGVRLDDIARTSTARRDTILAEAPGAYSPARVDTLNAYPSLRRSLWRTPDADMRAQWFDVMINHPGDYLGHRLDVFRWVLATPNLEACLPVHLGVSGPAAILPGLGVAEGMDSADRSLFTYATRFYDTPVYSHLTYVVISLVLIVLLVMRREPADMAMVGMLVGALMFTASFLVVSIACDYRYLYFLDLAAIAGVIYFAIDPRVRRAADVS